MSTSVELARHGLSWQNVDEPNVLDHGDPGLHPVGSIQRHQLAAECQARGGVDIVVAAPNLRSFGTAEPVANLCNAELIVHDGAREYYWARVGGYATKDVFPDNDLDQINKLGWDHRPIAGAETMKEGHHRFKSMVTELEATYSEQKVLIVSSSFILKCYIGGELGLTRYETVKGLKIGNCELLEFDPSRGAPVSLFKPDEQLEYATALV